MNTEGPRGKPCGPSILSQAGRPVRTTARVLAFGPGPLLGPAVPLFIVRE